MSLDTYRKLAQHLDDLPAGFPFTESGVELRILRRLFSPEEAELALHLTLFPEEAEVVASRAEIAPEEAAQRLEKMAKKGLIYSIERDGKLPKYRANGAIRQLFTDLQYARMRAIAENNDYKVEFDTANNLYKLYDDAVVVKTIDIGGQHSGISYGYVSTTNWNGDAISGSVTFTGSPPSVTFRPSGRANKNGSIYLKPTQDSTQTDRQRAISVITTGRVRIYKHNGTDWD